MQENNYIPPSSDEMSALVVEPNIQQDNIGKKPDIQSIHNSIIHKANNKSKIENLYSVDRERYSNNFLQKDLEKLSYVDEGAININDAYTRKSDGTYITRYDKGYMVGADNEDIYAQRQSTTDK